jgi:hypothetical protein
MAFSHLFIPARPDTLALGEVPKLSRSWPEPRSRVPSISLHAQVQEYCLQA